MSADRFKKTLRDLLKLIELSCSNYDSGDPDAGLSISINLRVLFHDTRSSTSLLENLKNRDVSLCNTFPSDMDGRYTLYYASDTFKIYATFKDFRQRTCLDFQPVNKWWSKAGLISGGQKYSRKDLVFTTANKDGGAHVDTSVSPAHDQLVKGVLTFVKDSETGHEVRTKEEREHFWLIRIFGHELLNSPDLLALTL